MKGQLPYHGLVLNVIYWLADHAILPGDDVILPGGEPAGIINKYQIEIDQAERHLRVRIVVQDTLGHQELVEIRVDHRAHDRVDLERVVVDTGGNVGHRRARPLRLAR